jgi:hypothetical protein
MGPKVVLINRTRKLNASCAQKGKKNIQTLRNTRNLILHQPMHLLPRIDQVVQTQGLMQTWLLYAQKWKNLSSSRTRLKWIRTTILVKLVTEVDLELTHIPRISKIQPLRTWYRWLTTQIWLSHSSQPLTAVTKRCQRWRVVEKLRSITKTISRFNGL